jgi:NHLM bacteriocin system ABC transporter ATP-binding protein
MSVPASILETFFATHGEIVSVINSRPLFPSDADKVYCVLEGKIELFSTEAASAPGARSHLVSVDKGGLFWGFDTSGMESQVLASGILGTRVASLETAALAAAAGSTLDAAVLTPAIEHWMILISERLAAITRAASIDKIAAPGTEATLAAFCRAGSSSRPVWAVVKGSNASFLGRSPIACDGSSACIPLAGGCWFEPEQQVTVRFESTAAMQSSPRMWEGLKRLHRWFLELITEAFSFRSIEDSYHQRSKTDYRDAARKDAWDSLVTVIGELPQVDDAVEESRADRMDELLLETCRVIGEAAGIQIVRHIDVKPSNDSATNLILISKSSRFRTRRVLLEGPWWERDHGALLAYRMRGETPVALTPLGASGYELYDPVIGSSEIVTRETAKTLAPFAEMFYRSLGDTLAGPKGFLKFASFGLRKEAMTVALMSVVVGVLGMLTPIFTSKIFDSVIPAGDRDMHFHYIMALVSAALATTGFDLVRSIAVLRIEGKMDSAGQAAVWSRMMDLPLTFFRRYTAGDLADRAHAVDAIRSIVSEVGVTAILGTTAVLFQGASMLFINFKLAFVGAGMIVLIASILITSNWMQLKLQRQEYSIRGKIAGIALQLLTGVSKIRVAAAEDHAFRLWATEFSSQKRIAFVIGRIQNFVESINRCFPLLCSIGLFGFFAYFRQLDAQNPGAAQISTGQFIAFNTAFAAVLNSVLQLGMSSLRLLEIVPIFERVRPVLEETPEVTDTRRHPGELRGNIELYHVNFRYQPDGPLILKNLDLKIKRGEFVALVGPSGSGKSTVLRLLLGFESPESGYVYFEGQDLASLDLREVRKQMGAVLQSSQLMPTTVYQNIIGASTTLTMDDAEWAAEKSGLQADIRDMPMGMHTVVSEGGGGFSGGQKQRLMIARALVHKPRIVLFDEATSALDNRTQRIVTQSLKEMDATRITIAHRLSTVIDADRIVVLDKGIVVEVGTYAELVAKGGVFYELARSQQVEGTKDS